MSQTWQNAHARGIVRVGTKPAPTWAAGSAFNPFGPTPNLFGSASRGNLPNTYPASLVKIRPA